MQLFSVDPTIFSKNLELIFLLKETLENGPQKLLISAHTFFHSPAQATAHSQELIFHIKKMSQDTSVSLCEVAAHYSDAEHLFH